MTKILVLDDDPDDGFLIEEAILDAPRDYDVTLVHCVDEALELLREKSFDCLLSDFRMGAWSALDVLASIKRDDIDVPVIVMTSGVSDEVDEAVHTAGASDFLPKDMIEPATIDRIVRYAVAAHSRQKLLRMVLDATASAMMLVDHDDRVILHNSRAEELAARFGKESDEALEHLVRITDGVQGVDVRIDDLVLDRSQTDVQDGRLVVLHDVTERARALAAQERTQRQLSHMALHDALTGLANRSGFEAEFDHRIEQCMRDGSEIAVLSFDVDRFKEVNDVHGHNVGDLLLKAIAGRLSNAVSSSDFIARLGGDEFVILVSGTEMARSGVAIAKRIAAVLRRPFNIAGQTIYSGTSVGVAVCPDHGATREDLLANADVAMYRAKRSSGDDVCAFDKSMDVAVRKRRQLTEALREAIENGELEVYLQAQASVADQTLTGYEALARWRREDGTVMRPDLFIPIAEETGLIVPLGALIMRLSAEEAMTWDDGATIAVNVSPIQISHTDLPALVRKTLNDTGLDPRRLEIEITESALIDDAQRTLRVLEEVRALGVSIAMDDFGTGYSSLSALQSFPFDKIKIDRSFVSCMDDPDSYAIVEAMVTLGRRLSTAVLAEGVETEEQVEKLKALGCTQMQGYLLGKPFHAELLRPQSQSKRKKRAA